MDRPRLVEQLIAHEGMRHKPYRCTAGKLTIGVGRNLDDRGISRREALLLLDNDITATQSGLDLNLPSWRGLSDARQMVIADMCFNLGWPTFAQFRQMLRAINAGDFAAAAAEMLDSRWARQVGDQDGQRAHTLARMMREG